MSEAYRLYDLLDSPFCLKARICLSLKQVPYERVTLTFSRLRELRRLNPLGKVPVLLAGERAIADSSQIARDLDEAFPRPGLLPKDPQQRAYCHLIEEWADESLSFIIGAFKWLNPANRERAYSATAELAAGMPAAKLALFVVRRRITRRYRAAGYRPASLPHLQERMAENLAQLRDLLEDKSFLLGRYVTLADLSVFAQLHWMSGYEEKRLIDAVPEVRRWMDQLEAVAEIQQAIRGIPPVAMDGRADEAATGL